MVLALCLEKQPGVVYPSLLAVMTKQTVSNVVGVLVQYCSETRGRGNEEVMTRIANDLGSFIDMMDHCTCNIEDSIEALARWLRRTSRWL